MNLTVTVARRPLAEGAVTRNALKWGTGGVNIDGSRIGVTKRAPGGLSRTPGTSLCGSVDGSLRHETGEESGHNPNIGRWPANVILVHKAGCRKVGTKQVPATSIHGTSTAVRRAGVHCDAGGHQTVGTIQPVTGYADEDGLESVDDWECVDGCPVAELDRQTGTLSTGTWNRQTDGAHPFGGAIGSPYQTWKAVEEAPGGASRFFLQVQETLMGSIPQELVSYLCNMIGAPGRPGYYWPAINDTLMAITPDNSIPGLVVRGEPTETQAKELMRILMPGAFLFLVAPEERPTGHVGACRIEDEGFEIRDAILVVREGGEFHYVPKASRGEREAGCGHLEGKTGAEACDREEGTAGLNNPRAGAGRTAEHVKNFHPTCKPVDVMERLLDDVPPGAVVLDPFMGSGTTGIACRRSGHSFVGIDRERSYLEIADARIRHWDRDLLGDGATIESPIPPHVPTVEVLDMGTLFWGDCDE